MPNWVKNEVYFNGDANQVRELLESIRPEGKVLGTIDFNRIIPMPESLNIEAGSSETEGYHYYKQYAETEIASVRRDCLQYAIRNPYRWELGRKAYENEKKYGFRDWYDWALANWGTKWNATEDTAFNAEHDREYLSFETAWSYPEPIYFELSRKFPTIEIQVDYADEDLGSNCGRVVFLNGKISSYHFGSEDEAFDFACAVWGYDAGEMREEYQNA